MVPRISHPHNSYPGILPCIFFLLISFLFIPPTLQADLGLDTDDFGSKQTSGKRVSGTQVSGTGLKVDGGGENNGTPGEEGGKDCLISQGNGATESGVCDEDGQCVETNSYVNLYTRKYQDDIIDVC